MLILGRVERIVLVVGHDTVSESRNDVLCVQVQQAAGKESLLAVHVSSPVEGFARAVTVAPIPKTSFVEQLGQLDAMVMEQVDTALRATLDL
ncbi:type II toxin-antitoxin system PemK/MazF family toxin [Nocardia huaxiensis]|uniref:Type II toxin-antitoxin system PemK/MazF family toxin n=1 Tax=Nocardia huaxiensis TaxID=2755382 RepID=A0A7D6VBP3_9NOCA|nr:type II toxin-antitoxin system PemK/MazF family toxin [Nocardia huaxiensis]QLY31193.1 type II toxin-antitoxin system PemK/MazF family toxin [Nocardia huaxiensis]UFS94722.1 type II toxin-antitoxin system PemK/MazF family toxin [Nocardia huaxiensis]